MKKIMPNDHFVQNGFNQVYFVSKVEIFQLGISEDHKRNISGSFEKNYDVKNLLQ